MSDPAAPTPPAPEQKPDTFTAEEYQKQVARAQRFEGLLADTEKRLRDVEKRFDGVDAEDYRASKAKLEEAEKRLAESDPKKLEEYHEKRFDKALRGWQGEKDELTKERDSLRAQVKTYAVTDKVMNEIGGLFNDDMKGFIKGEVERYCDLDDEGTIYVKDDNGKPALKGLRALTVKDFGDLLAEKYPSAARSTATGGSRDAAPGSKTRVPGVPQTYAELAAMPNAREVLDRMRREQPELVQKILATAPIGAR